MLTTGWACLHFMDGAYIFFCIICSLYEFYGESLLSSRVVSLQWTMTYLWLLFLRVGIRYKECWQIVTSFYFYFRGIFVCGFIFYQIYGWKSLSLVGVSMTPD